MPRAVTRAISTSFATRSYSKHSTSDNQSSGKATSTSEMFPSPRPGKSLKQLNSNKRSAPPTSSPLTRSNLTLSSGPVTPPRVNQNKKKRLNEATLPVQAGPMEEKFIKKFLDNYDLEVSDRIRRANQALQISIESARAQMLASISAHPRHILAMRVEDFLEPPLTIPKVSTSKENPKKRSSSQSIPPPHPHKTPRIAREGEIVYSARGSPILIAPKRTNAGAANAAAVAIDSSVEDEAENEPSFDTASDKSSSSESFSLPDEAAYTAQVIEQERNRILSSEGFFPRSSSMYHRSSGS